MTPLPPFLQTISFGDCDPAGIVYYPNIFRWMDAAFHNVLQSFGGHAALCRRLDAVGLGLMDAQAGFRAPLRPGEALRIEPAIDGWSGKTLTMTYTGLVADRPAFTGREVRGMFRQGPDEIFAAEIAGFREILEGRANG